MYEYSMHSRAIIVSVLYISYGYNQSAIVYSLINVI